MKELSFNEKKTKEEMVSGLLENDFGKKKSIEQQLKEYAAKIEALEAEIDNLKLIRNWNVNTLSDCKENNIKDTQKFEKAIDSIDNNISSKEKEISVLNKEIIKNIKKL